MKTKVRLVSLLCFGWLSSAGEAFPQGTVAQVQVEGKSGTSSTLTVQELDSEAYLREKLPTLPAPNQRVVQTLLGYPRGGEHDYWWPRKGESAYDGCTTDILIKGLPAMRGEAQGRTFCCGLTLEVALRVLQGQAADLPHFTAETLPVFKKLWFCEKLFSPGPTDALLAFGMGQQIKDVKDALPGDFVQLWRHNKSGHSVIFVDWARKTDGQIAGVFYWSTQPATKGIGFNREMFGEDGKAMDPASFSIVRLLPASQWKVPPVASLVKR